MLTVCFSCAAVKLCTARIFVGTVEAAAAMVGNWIKSPRCLSFAGSMPALAVTPQLTHNPTVWRQTRCTWA